MDIEKIRKKFESDDLFLASYISIVLWLVFQLYIVSMNWGASQYSDAGCYLRLAYDCYDSGSWYPTALHVESDNIIFNPGYVNFLILQLKVFGSLKFMPIINLLLNIVLLSAIYKITTYILSEKSGRLAIILFCLLPSNSFVVSLAVTELLVAALIYSALCLIRKSYLYLLLSAILLIYAEYIRPSAILFIPSIILFFYLSREFSARHVSFFFAALLALYVSLSYVVINNTDARKMGGVTGGVNLIMGANDDMSGRYEPTVFQKGKSGYVDEEYNVYQRDSILKNRAIDWMAKNPIKYALYIPLKMFYLWSQDVYWSSFYVDFKDHNNVKLFKSDIPKSKMLVVILRNISYYFIFLLALIGVWRSRRQLWGIIGLVLLPLLLNSVLIAAIVGAPRYHYLVNPILILFAVIGLLGIEKARYIETA